MVFCSAINIPFRIIPRTINVRYIYTKVLQKRMPRNGMEDKVRR